MPDTQDQKQDQKKEFVFEELGALSQVIEQTQGMPEELTKSIDSDIVQCISLLGACQPQDRDRTDNLDDEG